ncbi:sensor histidine kinase [Arcobacter sp. FWKO B]|uniref:sensor histidine kinase n=1 Tax=Arcobacter sp. FWKO B TaxID=2593672 RepID=UPI0018A3A231|nr:HAMP domain-containing sensor histidine kinase [Arcobacter sp. FWKO B]QOG12940.1 HAMP domain-containing histidine kinase [Arcobacter sp. FWKO B]
MLEISIIKKIVLGLLAMIYFTLCIITLLLLSNEKLNEILEVSIAIVLVLIIFATIVIYYVFNKYIKQFSEKIADETKLRLTLKEKLFNEIDKSLKKDVLLQKQLKFATIGELSTNIFNQWREYLNIITVSVGSIKVKQDLDMTVTKEDLYRMSENVFNSTNSMAEVISHFSSLTKDSAIKKKFIVYDCVNDVLKIMDGLFKDLHIDVKTNLEKNIEVMGIKSLFSQVILNVLVNIIDEFNSNNIENMTIKITLTKEGNNIIIKIKDNAGGINEDNIKLIFNQFYCSENDSLKICTGLYLCIQILETYFNGYMYCENEFDDSGLGASFCIVIPT